MHSQTVQFIFMFTLHAVNNVLGIDGDVVIIRAVRGRDSRLPCGQAKVFLDGPGSYALWLRNDRDVIYRFPNEASEKRARERIYSTNCDSDFCKDDTSLVIRKASDRDAGRYRCRIHYQASASVDFAFDLKLVDSTGLPRIYSGDGELINTGFVGPAALGSDVVLICEVEDKDPATALHWHRNGAQVQGAQTSRSEGKLRVKICVHKLTRGDLNAHYECLAQNSDITEPLSTGVDIKMYLAPMSVEIRLNNNYDFEAGQPRVVDCVVVGCVPPPAISWHLGKDMVRPSVHKELHDGNYTVSSLTLAPSLHDNHKVLVCRAYNSFLSTEIYQDKVTVNVGYRPVCQLAHEERVGAVFLESETVTCVVDSSPEPLQFSWTFPDSKTLYTSVNKVADYPHRYSSTLTWVSRDGDIGMLLCRATNTFGEQKKPCVFHVSAGGPPERPDCEVRWIYPNDLKVQCAKRWDGGRPQKVHLDIVDEDGTLIKNITDDKGHFYVPNAVDQHNSTAVLYATNARGKSEESIVYLHTLTPISEAGSNYIESGWMPYLQALFFAVACTIAATAITFFAKILLDQRDEHNEINPDVVPRSPLDGIFHREPDVVREDRFTGSTNITVNQLDECQNQYSLSPLSSCRVLLSPGPLSSDSCSSQQSYYV